jgi:monoamine oxidase
MKRLTDFKGGAQQDYFVGGAQQICELLAERLSARIELEREVTAIHQNDAGVTVNTAAGKRHARYCIVAVSPPIAARISFAPALRGDRLRQMQAMRLGSYTKAIAIYEHPWWKEQGLNGIGLATDGPVQMVVDGGSDTGRGVLVGFLTGPAADKFGALNPDQRRREATEAFAHLLGAAAAQPVDYLDLAWADQPHHHGAPVAFSQPQALARYGDLPVSPIGRVHWAGTDLARINNAYMDGAIESGERAAAEIVRRQT